MTKNTLRKVIRREAPKYLIKPYQIEIVNEGNGNVGAYIDIQTWKVHISIPQNLELSEQEAQILGKGIMRHEIGHWRYCPRDYENYLKISKGVEEAISESNGNLKSIASLLENIFADFVDNIANSYVETENEKEPDAQNNLVSSGFKFEEHFVHYYLREKTNAGHQLDSWMKIFIAVNQEFFIDPKDEIIKPEELNETEKQQVAQIAKILLGTLSEKYLGKLQHLAPSEKEEVVLELLDEKSWYSKAKEIAKILIPLMNSISTSFLMDLRSGEDEKNSIPLDPGNGGMKANGSSIAPSKDHGKTPLVYSTGGPASAIDFNSKLKKVDALFQYLDAIYKSATKDLHAQIRVKKEMKDQIWNAKVGSELHKEDDAEHKDINVRDIKWINGELFGLHRRVGIDGGSNAIQSLPNLLFIVDSSSSMNWPVLDGSQALDFDLLKKVALNGDSYDYVIRTVYSVLNTLQRSDILSRVQLGILNFSGITAWSGWKAGNEKELNDFKRFLFAYQNGGTVLNVNALKTLYEHSSGPIISILLSDGEFELNNANEILRNLVGFWKKNPFIFVAIKSNTPFSKILESRGLSVKRVTNLNDLSDLVLDFTKKELEKYKMPI